MLGVTTKSGTKTQYAQLKSKMSKDWKNAKPLRTAIKSISVLSVELKNMYLSHVKADYVHLVGQKQQTNGLIESIISF